MARVERVIPTAMGQIITSNTNFKGFELFAPLFLTRRKLV